MKRVTIIGLGLMGGSLGMALRSLAGRPSTKGGRWRVTGVGRDKAHLKKALSLGAADEGTTDFVEGVKDADVVVLAVPVDDIVPWARKVGPHLKPGALVMDVGSVKGPIVRSMTRSLARRPSTEGGSVFIGAHPMCGSEKSGVENARADLFQGAPCVLTPLPGAPKDALKEAEYFWTGVGAKVLLLSPEEHDRRVAIVSHLPHLIAQALVLTAGGEDRRASDLAAGSFRDATRVAAADPELWAQIFSMNRPALLRAAAVFQKQLRSLLKNPSAARLSQARKQRQSFLGAAS